MDHKSILAPNFAYEDQLKICGDCEHRTPCEGGWCYMFSGIVLRCGAYKLTEGKDSD